VRGKTDRTLGAPPHVSSPCNSYPPSPTTPWLRARRAYSKRTRPAEPARPALRDTDRGTARAGSRSTCRARAARDRRAGDPDLADRCELAGACRRSDAPRRCDQSHRPAPRRRTDQCARDTSRHIMLGRITCARSASAARLSADPRAGIIAAHRQRTATAPAYARTGKLLKSLSCRLPSRAHSHRARRQHRAGAINHRLTIRAARCQQVRGKDPGAGPPGRSVAHHHGGASTAADAA
jgi:hypothetical protein